MKITTILVGFIAIAPLLSTAHNLTAAQSVPAVSVTSHGELILQDGKISYQEWNSGMLVGKVRVVQAIAGRKSAKKMNAPLIKAITKATLPQGDYQTTTIINQDDAMWGTGSFVKSSAEESKEGFPWSSIVLDKRGMVAKAWALDEESSTIILLDRSGQVLFAKTGALSQEEITQVLNQIKERL